MAIDPNVIMGIKPVQLANPLEQYMQVQQIQQAQNQSRLQDLMYGEKQREVSEGARLNEIYKGAVADDGTLDRTKLYSGVASAGLGSRLPALQKSFAETDAKQADVGKTRAETQAKQIESLTKANGLIGSAAGAIVQNPTYDNAVAVVSSLRQQFGPDMSKQFGLDTLEIPQDPAQLKAWAQNHYLASVDAGKQLEDARIKSEGAATRQSQQQIAAGHDATSRANTAANIRKDFTVAGLNPDGTPGGEIETTAQAIAKGQLPPPSGMALMNPKNQRVLARVMEINPDYDYTTVAAKKKAAADFASGSLGNALRSVSTANDHLDQLGELVDALGNGSTQLINKAKNKYLTATGNPAPTNFDAIKNIVGQEVVKAIVAGGGSMTEREEAAKTFSTASSPAQLKGAIQHYRMVMGAQADNLMEQRRAAGLPDSTLPNYKKGAGAGSSTPPTTNAKGWTLMMDAQGNRAYVSPDGKQHEDVH